MPFYSSYKKAKFEAIRDYLSDKNHLDINSPDIDDRLSETLNLGYSWLSSPWSYLVADREVQRSILSLGLFKGTLDDEYNKGLMIDAVFSDFSKAFYRILNTQLLYALLSLQYFGLNISFSEDLSK